MRAPVGRSGSRGFRTAWRATQALLILSLLVSLLTPLAPVAPVLAQQGDLLPPPLPAPSRVSLAGSFQTALGCPADFDSSCPQTQLQDNNDGSWSAVLPVPPGDYSFRIVASSDIERSLGERGDPNGADLFLSVPGDAAGAYFSYDSLTGEILAEPVTNLVTLTTDLGQQFAMAPARDGGYELLWDAQPGTYGFQVLIDGQPVTQDSVSLDSDQRVVVAVDDSGAVTRKDTVRDTRVDVAAVDQAGSPRADSCFAIIDSQNRLRSQACDEDDGQFDGFVSLRVPNGLNDDTYTLRETAAPEGGDTAPDQDVSLGGGRFEVAAQAAAPEGSAPPATEPGIEGPGPAQPVLEPGDQPGRLTVIPVDDAGQPLPGACFAIVEFGFEFCDDDLDGAIVFDAIPSAPLTLRETTPPAGFTPVADLPITIEPTGARLRIPHDPVGGEDLQPVETETATETPGIEPQETPETQPVETPQVVPGAANQVVLTLRDRDGNPVSGGCWALTERGNGGTTQRCDGDDGSEDGTIIFDAVPAGRYRLDEVNTPRGFRPADSQGVEVVDGAPAQVAIEYRPEGDQGQDQGQRQEGPGRLVIDVTDAAGNPVPQTCFDLRGPLELTDVCDRQDDGRLNVPDLPAGDYTLTQTGTAEGFTTAQETTVTVPAGETVELPIRNPRQGEESGQEASPPVTEAESGSIVVAILQDDGSPVSDACVNLSNDASEISVCDQTEQDENAEPGQLEIAVTPGDYTLDVIPPDGFETPDPTQIQVQAGQPARVEIVLSATSPLPANGNLRIRAEDSDGNLLPFACYAVEIPPGGQGFGPFCDDDGNGEVEIQGVTPGPIAVVEATPPIDTATAEQPRQELEINAGAGAEVIFTHGGATQQQAADGSIAVRIVDAAGQPVDACINLDGDAESFSVCDNDQEDRDGQPGAILIEQLLPGPYAIFLSGLPQGAAAPPEQQVEVVAGEAATVEFVLGSGPGTLVLFVENEGGDRLGGSCFTLQSATETIADICDQGDDGRLNIPDLPSGEYRVTQTQATEGLQIAPEQTVTVPPGQTVEVTLQNRAESAPETPTPESTPSPTPAAEPTATPEPEATAEPQATAEQPAAGGTLAVVNLSPDNNLLGGGCFTVTDANGAVVAEGCDNDRRDFDNSPGVIAFGALPAGQYTITQTSAADGFNPASPTQIDHGADAQAVDLFSEAASGETGTVELAAFDDAGNAIAGQCYTLAGSAGTFGPFCDDGEGDASGDPGVLIVEGLPEGTYEATLETAEAEPDAELAQQVKQRRSVSIRRGERPTRANFNVRAQQNRRGDLLIRVRDRDGNYLGGACFGLIADGETSPSQEVCDNRNGDQNSSQGRILITGLRPGRYTLTQTEAPNGYQPAADQSVRVQSGSVREVAVTNQFAREQPATLDVETLDRQGNLLTGACYAILRGNNATEACDADSGADGVTRFADVEPGSYVVRQIQAPAGGFAPAGATATLLDAGQTATVTVVNESRPGSLLLRKTDEAGQFLANACFALIRDTRTLYSVCDNDASDGNPSQGTILLSTIVPATYILRETQSPDGYLPADDQEVVISPNQRSQVTIIDVLAPPPERIGDLRLFKVDTQGRALAGSCFALIDGNGRTIRATCDADDGADDGVILIEDVAIGDYTLRETRRPSADYEPAADLAVTIRENQTVDVEVVNRLRTGRLLIRKLDPNGVRLADACFDLAEDGAGAACTDENGELLFTALLPGVYTITETQAPAGYLPAASIDPVTVRPGSTATIDVVDQPAPPPPDSGSIQIVKFLCPAVEGGAGIAFVDSSDPDGGGLARTAGCDLGDAAFALDGPSGPLQFRTGEGGRYQATLPTGNYVLTELATGAAEELSISLNTLTTVVVVNYIEPEGEEPATIDVIKYTCDPGFQGRVWADFAEGCLSAETLTNNVSFRLSGMVSARRVTGDAGIGGATRFDGLPPGDYRLREEAPSGTVAIYAFCGLDPAAPDGRSVGDVLDLRLSAGQAVTCQWFNVPEDLAGNTGAITVYKYACPVTTPSSSYDWYGRCDPQGQGVRFGLSFWDGSAFVPVTVAATDSDGILRLTRLQPGIYDLKEVDATWCYAESDSVNADGHVVVDVGQRSSVWIFNCVGAKNPPNTGAGPLWSSPATLPGSGSALGAGLGILWPLAGLTLWRLRRAA